MSQWDRPELLQIYLECVSKSEFSQWEWEVVALDRGQIGRKEIKVDTQFCLQLLGEVTPATL